MIKLLIVFAALLVAWQLFKMAGRQRDLRATLEEARTTGLEEAGRHIQSAILLEDYAEARGIAKEELMTMVRQGQMPFYCWRQYTYIENRELINKNK